MCFIGFGSRGGSGGGGTITGATNIGAGDGLFAQDNAGVLEFKSLIAGTDITFTVGASDITIDSTAGGVQYPLTNVLFVNANGNPDTPRKGDIERPYPTYADALADFVSGDVIVLTENLTEVITLVPDLNILSLGVSVDNGAGTCITDAGVSCTNVRIYGSITLNPSTGSLATLTGLAGDIIIDDCISIQGATSTGGWSTGVYDVTINGKHQNDCASNFTCFNATTGNFTFNGDVSGTTQIAPAFVGVNCQNLKINGNITNTSLLTSTFLFCDGLEINGNIDLPNATIGIGISNTDNLKLRGDYNAPLSNSCFLSCDYFDWRGEGNSDSRLLGAFNYFLTWYGKGTCQQDRIGDSLFDSYLNVELSCYTPVYARAGGGFSNSYRTYFDGKLLVNCSPFSGCVEWNIFAKIEYYSIQNLLDPDLTPSAFFKGCQGMRFFGICELDDVNLPIALDGGGDGNYYGGTFNYLGNNAITGGTSPRAFAGGWCILNPDNVIDCTLLAGNTTVFPTAYIISSLDGNPHTVNIPRLNYHTRADTGTANPIPVVDDSVITVRGGWLTRPDQTIQSYDLETANATVKVNGYGLLFDEIAMEESTSVMFGGTLQVNAGDNTEFDIIGNTAVEIRDNSNPEVKTATRIEFGSLFNLTVTNLATEPRTNIAISLANTPETDISFTNSFTASVNGVNQTVYIAEKSTDNFTAEQEKRFAVLGRLVHTNNLNISFPVQLQSVGYGVYSTVRDFVNLFPAQNVEGNEYSGVAGTNSVQKTEGKGFRLGSNYSADPNNPNIQDIPSANPTTHAYRYQNGSGGFTQTAFSTLLDPTVYDNGSGVPQAVPNNQWTTQCVFVFAGSGTMFIQYGQETYASKSSAIESLSTNNPVIDPNLTNDAIFRGWFVIEEGCTDTTDANFFEWRPPLSERGGGGGTAVVVDLQTAYESSVTPEIVTDDSRGAVTVKQGTALATTNQMEVLDSSDVIVWSVDANGDVTGNTFNGVALTSAGSRKNILKEDGGYEAPVINNTFVTTASLTPDSDSADQVNVTALAGAMTINAPSGTPTNGQTLIIRIEDDGLGARALTWNANYRVVGVTLPVTTTLDKVIYVGCRYNSADSVWDVIAIKEEA